MQKVSVEKTRPASCSLMSQHFRWGRWRLLCSCMFHGKCVLKAWRDVGERRVLRNQDYRSYSQTAEFPPQLFSKNTRLTQPLCPNSMLSDTGSWAAELKLSSVILPAKDFTGNKRARTHTLTRISVCVHVSQSRDARLMLLLSGCLFRRCHMRRDVIVVPWPPSLQNPSVRGKTEGATCLGLTALLFWMPMCGCVSW